MDDVMEEVLLHKLLTLEVIVETIMDTLIDAGIIDQDELDKSIIEKIKQLEKVTQYSEEEPDYSHIFMGPKGEA
jgi:hypothetical protein|tara:strand:+ start:526 stop:747 length:222 start_codon:yes stop_codon:yes gene_type:complete